jgi:hypothetical protein
MRWSVIRRAHFALPDDVASCRAVQVIGSQFSGAGAEGDFSWMIERPEYADALFVFNDNEEQFRAYVKDPAGGAGCSPGGGNAVIRPYRCADPPRAAGIPTGSGGGGYPSLTDAVRGVIDDAIAVIEDLLASGRYERLVYSAASDGGLGTGIFRVGDDVKRYIVDELRKLGD